MQLEGKNAIVYGAAGPMGSSVARAFAREGARVYLAGRTMAPLEKLAGEIRDAGGSATAGQVDAMDTDSVARHADLVASAGGSIDISFNAVGIRAVQDIPLTDMSLDDFMLPISDACRTHFITATEAARRMISQASGVIIILSATSAYETRHEMGGFSIANAGIEALTRSLAGEVGRKGVRVVGMRCNFTPETYPQIPPDYTAPLIGNTILGRLPRLSEVAGTAVYLASDSAGAMTGAVVNLSCGAIIP